MSTNTNALDQIANLQQQIAQLRDAAVLELRVRREALEAEIRSIDIELESITGKPAGVKRTRRTGGSAGGLGVSGKTPDLQELKEILGALPDKTLNIRKNGFDTRNIKVLASANPHLLGMGGKGAWPTVTLLK